MGRHARKVWHSCGAASRRTAFPHLKVQRSNLLLAICGRGCVSRQERDEGSRGEGGGGEVRAGAQARQRKWGGWGGGGGRGGGGNGERLPLLGLWSGGEYLLRSDLEACS